MRALKDGGILSVTLWNKEEPPKSVLKLYATMAEAAREVDDGDIADRFFVVSSYLSTATVLYKRGGFTADEVAKLREHTRAMSFDEIYYPGFDYDQSQTAKVLDGLRAADLLRTTAAARSQGCGRRRTQRRRRRRRRTSGRGTRKARHRVPATTMGQIGLAPSRSRRLGRDRRPLRVRHPPAHQRRGPISRPT